MYLMIINIYIYIYIYIYIGNTIYSNNRFIIILKSGPKLPGQSFPGPILLVPLYYTGCCDYF